MLHYCCFALPAVALATIIISTLLAPEVWEIPLGEDDEEVYRRPG